MVTNQQKKRPQDIRVYEWTAGRRGGAHRDPKAAERAVLEALRAGPATTATLRTVRVDADGRYVPVDIPLWAIADGERVHWRVAR